MRRSALIALPFFLCASIALAEPLNMTISGKAGERVEFETLVPSPDIPGIDALSLSLDGGKTAAESEVEPLSPAQAALFIDSTRLPMPSFSAIPAAPYIVQAVPTELLIDKDKKPKKGQPRLRFTNWEFTVVDENNVTWFESSGEGFPPNPLTWDGTKDGAFVLEPNRSYYSYLKLTAHGEPDRTFVGDSVRYLAFIRQSEADTIIRFGERVYERDRAQFSAEAKIYLDDLAQRLSHIMSFYKETDESTWHVAIIEPESRGGLGELRKNLWKEYLQNALGRNMPDNHFSVETTKNPEASVSITFPRSKAPLTDLALRGEARSTMKVPLEQMASLVKITKAKEAIIVDLRHDRLFLPGSAYLRDEALPYLAQAMVEVRNAMNVEKRETPMIREPDSKSREEKKRTEATQKKLVLRSYTQKLPGKENDREEDPKLTATRSKVLFMLFAREGLTP